jgi:AcrR family transcriptional regulator
MRRTAVSEGESSRPGPRQRRKAKARAAIQRQALGLFREHGYEATTMRQIAEAADISESTLFRYFPTKEDLVLWDQIDLAWLVALRAVPPGQDPIAALRRALGEALAGLTPEQRSEQRERMTLVLSVPPLLATLVGHLREAMRRLATAAADRTGLRPDDPGPRALAGAITGVCLSAVFAWAEDPDADLAVLFDEAMSQLESGLPLGAPDGR